MKFLSVLIGFLLAETEQRILVIISVSDWHVSESGSETTKNLLLFLLNQKQLHVTANCIVGTLIDTNQITPFSSRINSVIHYLTISEFWFLFKDSLRSICIVDIGVINVLFTNNTKSVLSDPSPESNWFINLTLLNFSFGGEIKNLNNSLLTLRSSQSNNVLRSVHEDTLSFHWFSFKSKIFCRVNDGTISLIFDTDVLLGFKSHLTKLEKIRIKTEVGKLENLVEVKR
jgi:hypothetical protein